MTAELLTAVREKAQEMVAEPVDRLLITCPGDYRIGARELEVLAADSIPYGGADIDALLAEEIRRVTGAPADRGDGAQDAELQTTAAEAKKKLSPRDHSRTENHPQP